MSVSRLSVVLLLVAAPVVEAQSAFDTRTVVSAGLSQPLLFGGVNVAVSTTRGRLVADYSHGAGLDLNASDGAALTDAERDLGLDVDVPWTTGGGVGYRLTSRLDVRAEVKAHRFEVTAPDGEATAYTTVSVGPSVYYSLPVWRGLRVEPSVRYWPTVAHTLDADAAQRLGTESTPHEAHSFEAFVNVSVGWAF